MLHAPSLPQIQASLSHFKKSWLRKTECEDVIAVNERDPSFCCFPPLFPEHVYLTKGSIPSRVSPCPPSAFHQSRTESPASNPALNANVRYSLSSAKDCGCVDDQMNTLNLNMESSSKLQWAQPKCVPPAKRKERSWFTSASRMGANEANPDAIDTEKVFQYPSTPRGPRTQTISAGSRIKVFGTDIGGSCEAKGVKNHVTRAIDINRQPSWTGDPQNSNLSPGTPGVNETERGVGQQHAISVARSSVATEWRRPLLKVDSPKAARTSGVHGCKSGRIQVDGVDRKVVHPSLPTLEGPTLPSPIAPPSPALSARAPRRSNSRSSSHSTPETTPSSPGLEKLEVGYDDDEERETNFDDDESASDAEKASGARGGTKTCAVCNTKQTPLWRNAPSGPKSLCNACGIKYKKIKTGKRKPTAAELPMFMKIDPGLASLKSGSEQLAPCVGHSPLNRAGLKARGRCIKQEAAAAALVEDYSHDHLDGVKAAGYNPAAHPRKRSRLCSQRSSDASSGTDEDIALGSADMHSTLPVGKSLPLFSQTPHKVEGAVVEYRNVCQDANFVWSNLELALLLLDCNLVASSC